jgi:predicted nucleic acid-binding protein
VAVESLPKLPAGIDIFLDANVFIYAFGGRSKQCLELLFRCAREEVYGVTTIEASRQFKAQRFNVQSDLEAGSNGSSRFNRSRRSRFSALRRAARRAQDGCVLLR